MVESMWHKCVRGAEHVWLMTPTFVLRHKNGQKKKIPENDLPFEKQEDMAHCSREFIHLKQKYKKDGPNVLFPVAVCK